MTLVSFIHGQNKYPSPKWMSKLDLGLIYPHSIALQQWQKSFVKLTQLEPEIGPDCKSSLKLFLEQPSSQAKHFKHSYGNIVLTTTKYTPSS